MSSLLDRIRARRRSIVRLEEDMHAYQDMAWRFLYDNPYSALFVDTGLGKTIIVLTLINRLLLELACERVLIIAPVRVANETWPTEIDLWGHTAGLNFTVIRAEDDEDEVIQAGRDAEKLFKQRSDYAEVISEHKRLQAIKRDEMLFATTKEERAAVRVMPIGENPKSAAQRAMTAKKAELRERRMRSSATLHIINREALTWLVDQYTVWVHSKRRKNPQRKIVGWPYDVVIIDESSSFKDHSAARFKALAAVRQQGFISRLHELTATPAGENYMGLFAQIFLMDKGERFGRGITAWQQKYFSYNQYTRVHTLLPGSKEKISEAISDICLVMQSRDYLDEEEPLFLDRKISMLPEELKQYQRFEREFILDTVDEYGEAEEIEAESASALSSKLLQMASGSVYNNTGQTRVLHSHKLDDLTQLAEELSVAGEPLMVGYWYKSSLARLKKAFPKAVVADARGKFVKPWNDGKIPMLLIHPASAGHGLNLQYGPGHDLYMFDMCWSWELFYQLFRRLARQGQKKQVRIHMPQTVGTNDEIVAGRLRLKEDAQQVLFDLIMKLRRRFSERRQATERKTAA